MLERRHTVHYCCKCGKGMAYEEKSMIYLYKVETTMNYLWSRDGRRILNRRTVPKAQRAYNLCDECSKAFNDVLDGFFEGGKQMPNMTMAEWQDASPIPTEAVEQERLFQWASMCMGKYPELENLYHIPNEGKRSRMNGARLKRQGLKKGVPDICLPCARCGCHALYIELKRMKDGRPTKDQLDWIDRLTLQGNMALVCEGWERAAEVIEAYLEGRL